MASTMSNMKIQN